MKEIWRTTNSSNFIHLQTHWSTNPQHLSVSWANFLPVYWFILRNVLRRCKENNGLEGAVRVYRLILICKNPKLARMYLKRKPGSCGKVESFFQESPRCLTGTKKWEASSAVGDCWLQRTCLLPQQSCFYEQLNAAWKSIHLIAVKNQTQMVFSLW